MNLLQWRRSFPDGKLPEEIALNAIRQLAGDLHKAHIESAYHRDIIPSTIIVEEDENGKASFNVPDLATVAENHGEIGARRYLAPEQWWNARQNTASDQYALAVLFVDLVTGTVPFHSAFETGDETVMRNAVCNQHAKLPSECPRRDVLAKALSKDPRARYHSCSSFIAALTADAGEVKSADENELSHHREHSHNIRQKKKHFPVFKTLLALCVIAGGGYYGWKSGIIEDALNNKEDARLKQIQALKELRAQQSAAEEKERLAQLASVRSEIKLQEVAAAQALTNLQSFLETGAAAVFEARKESLSLRRNNVCSELQTLEKDFEKLSKTEQALCALRSRSIPYAQVAGDIPDNCEVAVAYKLLLEESVKMKDLKSQFTSKHPSVTSQEAVITASIKRFVDANARTLKRVQDDLKVLREKIAQQKVLSEEAIRQFEENEGKLQVARLKLSVLEKNRERESDRLAELRRREFDIQFNTKPKEHD